MALLKLLPEEVQLETGWDQEGETLIDLISDNNLGTVIKQEDEECDLIVTITNITDPDIVTINNITATIAGVAGRSGSCSVTVYILDSDATLQEQTFEFDSLNTIQTTDEYTTSLTADKVNSLRMRIDPDEAGFTLQEAYITVDYDIPILSQGTITLFKGSVQLNLGQVVL